MRRLSLSAMASTSASTACVSSSGYSSCAMAAAASTRDRLASSATSAEKYSSAVGTSNCRGSDMALSLGAAGELANLQTGGPEGAEVKERGTRQTGRHQTDPQQTMFPEGDPVDRVRGPCQRTAEHRARDDHAQ